MGQENVYISYNYPCIISFLVKISLVKLKYLYFQYSWISIMKNKIVTKWKGWKDVGTCQNVWPLSSQVSTFSTVLWNCKRIWNWNLDRNLIMTLLIMVICTVLLEKLYTVLKETCNSFKKWPLNFWWIPNKTTIEVEKITNAATLESCLHLSYKNTQILFL